MRVRLDDNSTHRFWVSSEEDNSVEYGVDICCYPVGLDENKIMIFNGRCFLTKTEEETKIHGCKDFLYRCEPRLKKPENMGKIFRCKHCRAAEEYALKLLKPLLLKHDPNPDDPIPFL